MTRLYYTDPALLTFEALVQRCEPAPASHPGAFAVFVAEGKDEAAVARVRDVRLGRVSGNRVAIDSGLQVGDRVVVSGASLLTDGDPVRVIPGSEGE